MPTVESLNNDNGDGNKNGKKAMGLISKTTTMHVHHAFSFVHFLAIFALLRLISRSVEGVNARQRPSFSFPEL